MKLNEWERRQFENGNSIIIVADHKMGDVEPASIVLDDELTQMMDR